MFLYHRIVMGNDDVFTSDYSNDLGTARQVQFLKRPTNHLGAAPVPNRNRFDGLSSTTPE